MAQDHPLILKTLADYKYALRKHQEEQEIRKQQEQQAQRQREEEVSRRYAAELAAREEAQRRANSLVGKVGKFLANDWIDVGSSNLFSALSTILEL